MLLNHCSQDVAVEFIKALMKESDFTPKLAGSHTSVTQIEITHIGELKLRYLTNYIMSRGIPVDLAKQYCVEIVTKNTEKDRLYNVIGFPNNSRGFALKSPSGFKSTTKAGITTIGSNGEMTLAATSGAVAVFEGFFDFLSYMVMMNKDKPGSDIVVLNSVTNLTRALPYLKQHSLIEAYLDNDKAGRACLESIKNAIPGASVLDRSSLYEGFNDLNDMLKAQLPPSTLP